MLRIDAHIPFRHTSLFKEKEIVLRILKLRFALCRVKISLQHTPHILQRACIAKRIVERLPTNGL
jgi:hypothetical protein